ncbi:hypothetical protein [Flaviaesturariibacter amylovorans]|uniref:DUF4488 domain-containing protein n=1 Tax=Flaviaesturariibacter amylovorans TaxID=1084520 RepID=A0ABP8GW35_9BACT
MKPSGSLLLLLLALFLSGNASAQGAAAKTKPASTKDLTGIWHGYFVTDGGEQYKLEFQIAQKKAAVTGVSYSYLDQRFYGKATMTGNFQSTGGRFNIQELRTTEVRNMGGGGTCLMNYKFDVIVSGREIFLEGTYVGKSEDRANPKNNGKWGDCGGGKVMLRRVEESDFYVEPFLKNRPKPGSDVARTPAKPAPKTNTPAARVPAKPPVRNTTTARVPAKQPAAPATGAPATATPNVPKETTVAPAPKKIEVRPVPVPVETRNRQNETARVLTVGSDEVLVKLYDNGEVDNDTVSIYLDNKLVLSHKRLSAAPIELTVKLSEETPEHVLVMVAENMGRIPPNTSLMLVYDGDKRHEVQITSTEQKNAMVRFRYQKSGQ